MMTNPACTRRTFTRREWLMSLALILMLEAWVLNLSYTFKDEQSVINYISFAATIASLLLAVIAIIYGFYQSDGQQKTAGALELQIDSMKSVQLNLDSASTSISEQIQSIAESAEHLARIRNSVEATHSQLGELAGGVSTIRQMQDNLQEMVKRLTTNGEKVVSDELQGSSSPSRSRRILRFSTFEADLVGYWLRKYQLVSATSKVDYVDFLVETLAAPLGRANFMNKDMKIWGAAGFQIISILRAFGLVSINKSDKGDGSVLTLSKELEGELEVFGIEVKGQELTAEGVVLIDSAVSQWKAK